MSVTKYKGEYVIYFPYIDASSIKDRICSWWGTFENIDDSIWFMKDKIQLYKNLEIDKKLLRRLKLEKICLEKKKKLYV